jgi:hypothetical protein
MVSKFRAAAESFVRTFVQSFIGSLALIQFSDVDLSAAKALVLAAASAAVAAGIAAAARVFYPIQTDPQGKGVEGVSA